MRAEILRLGLGLAALALLLYGTFKVVSPFIVPILWALILGSATWPAYRRLRWFLRGRTDLSAFVMTLALLVGVVVPTLWLGFSMINELGPELDRFREWAGADELVLPDWVRQVPGLEEQLQDLARQSHDSEARKGWLVKALKPAQKALQYGRNVLRAAFHVLLTVFTLFFVYRDGEALAAEARALLDRIAGGKGLLLIGEVRQTVSAVFYGWLLTAGAQGLAAMFGYWVAGLRAPVLLGVATGLMAILPFGVGLVWVPIIVALFASGAWGKALFITLWSLLVVSLIDNLLRPILIAEGMKVPFILVFFGIIGGLVAYGLLGLVLGPVFLAVLLALWRQARDVLAEPEFPSAPV
ncbi:MAG: AI-2E family transporter [Acidobacteria bacterium]|nr:AI-2E family transporter [Acidobacteriota bacterium]